MYKFLAGLVLGIVASFFAFKHQVYKVDVYSARVNYLVGHVDEANDPGSAAETTAIACRLYSNPYFDSVPYGYTIGRKDEELKEICQNPPVSQEQ